MFTSLLSHLLCAWFAFLLPSFATFKALSHRPASEAELERWSMYWTVIGAFVAFEYVAERLISWFPFYWEVKTLFLLFLSLPQIQGSTYVYNTYLQPFFVKNEADLDAGIIATQRRTFVFVQDKLSLLVNYAVAFLNKQAAAGQGQAGAPTGQPGQPAAGLSLDYAMGLWRTYGSSVLGALQPAAAQAKSTPAASPTPSPSASITAFQANVVPNTERKLPQTPSLEPESLAPPFPVPQLS